MSDIVLWCESPGLGDHLIFSTIPELFARLGHRVYVSRMSRTRNKEVLSLLYEENPFISGWSNDPPNAATGRPPRDVIEGLRLKSIIQSVELSHGLPGTNLYPRIYYKPRFRPEFSDAILVDPCSSSQPFPSEYFDSFFRRLQFPRERTYVLESRHSGRNGRDSLRDYPRARVANLHDYIDTVYSSLAYVGTESGGSALASAIRQDKPTPEIYAVTTTLNWNHRVYIYPNITYTIVSGLQRDW